MKSDIEVIYMRFLLAIVLNHGSNYELRIKIIFTISFFRFKQALSEDFELFVSFSSNPIKIIVMKIFRKKKN